jgi:MFS family permease
VIMVGLVSSFAMNFGVWMPLLAKNELNTGPGGFGLLMAALGLGSLMGALVLAFRARGPQPRRMLATAAMLGAGEIALAVLTEYKPVIPLSLALVLLLGFSMTSTMAMANTTVQSNAPENLRGRVMSVYMMVFAGSAPFGALLAGATASAIDTPTSVLLGGAITLAATLIIAVRTGVLQGRHSPVPVLQSAQTRFKD